VEWDVSGYLLPVLFSSQELLKVSLFLRHPFPAVGRCRCLAPSTCPQRALQHCWDSQGHSTEVLDLCGAGDLYSGLLIRAGKDASS